MTSSKKNATPGAAPLLDLQATHNPNRWFMPVRGPIVVGATPARQFLFGGAGLAASILAMERTCGRPTIWATAQYLSYAGPGTVVDFDVIVPIQGRHNTQARVIAHVADKEILTVNAALGERPDTLSYQWVKAPIVPRPEECPSAPESKHSNLRRVLEFRIATGGIGIGEAGPNGATDGRVVFWVRGPGMAVDVAMLAMFADFLPAGQSYATGKSLLGKSLDNTLRIRRIVPTDWVLCEIQMEGAYGGYGHGRMHLFAEDGTLMAIAQQSFIMREYDGD
jgi:acyl-CoA thioesterase